MVNLAAPPRPTIPAAVHIGRQRPSRTGGRPAPCLRVMLGGPSPLPGLRPIVAELALSPGGLRWRMGFGELPLMVDPATRHLPTSDAAPSSVLPVVVAALWLPEWLGAITRYAWRAEGDDTIVGAPRGVAARRRDVEIRVGRDGAAESVSWPGDSGSPCGHSRRYRATVVERRLFQDALLPARLVLNGLGGSIASPELTVVELERLPVDAD